MDQQSIITGMHAGDKSMHYEAMNRWNKKNTGINYEFLAFITVCHLLPVVSCYWTSTPIIWSRR
jgi:hypothetical protein